MVNKLNYDPTDWEDNQIIYESDLDKIEEGIANATDAINELIDQSSITYEVLEANTKADNCVPYYTTGYSEASYSYLTVKQQGETITLKGSYSQDLYIRLNELVISQNVQNPINGYEQKFIPGHYYELSWQDYRNSHPNSYFIGVYSSNGLEIDYDTEIPYEQGDDTIKYFTAQENVNYNIILKLTYIQDEFGLPNSIVMPRGSNRGYSITIRIKDLTLEEEGKKYDVQKNIIAEAFDENNEYHAGDYVWYNNVLYYFTQNHFGEWSEEEDDVELVSSVMDEITKNKSQEHIFNLFESLGQIHGSSVLENRELTMNRCRLSKTTIDTTTNNDIDVAMTLLGKSYRAFACEGGTNNDINKIIDNISPSDFITIPKWLNQDNLTKLILRIVIESAPATFAYTNSKLVFCTRNTTTEDCLISKAQNICKSANTSIQEYTLADFDNDSATFWTTAIENKNFAFYYFNTNSQSASDINAYFGVYYNDIYVRYDEAQTLTTTQQAQVRENIGAADALAPNGEVAIDKSNEYTAYITKYSSGAIRFVSSATSISYKKLCRVKSGEKYALYVLNADPAANTSNRAVYVTDESDLVKQELTLWTTSGRWNVLAFTAEYDGWLNVCVDKDYLDMKIRHGGVWEIEKSIAPAEQNKAISAHSIGELIVVNGRLYQVTAPITANETITGSVAETTVAEQLTAKTISISGLTPTITAASGAAYNCIGTGTIAEPVPITELVFIPSTTGICSVRFISGTPATALTIPSYIKMPNWWTGVEPNTTYEITVTDKIYAEVNMWTDSNNRTGNILYNKAQTLTDVEKRQVRENIDAVNLLSSGATVAQVEQSGTTYRIMDAGVEGRVNALHNLIDYGYGAPMDNASVGAGYLRVTRVGTRYILNTTSAFTASSTPVKVILQESPQGFTGSFPTGQTPLALVNGHRYRLHMFKVSGTATNAVAAKFYAGTTSSVGIDTTSQKHQYSEILYDSTTYENGLYACIYISRTNTGNMLTNYTCDIVLEDITDSNGFLRYDIAQTLRDTWKAQILENIGITDVVGLNSRVNALHNLVDYNYSTATNGYALLSSYTTGTVRFVRTGTRIMINGAISPNSAGTAVRVKLNGTPTAAITTANIEAWTDPLVLTDGHTYRLRAHTVSGTATTRNNAMFVVYNYGESSAIGTHGVDGSDYIYTFTYNNGANGVQIAFGWQRTAALGATFDNWVAEVTLEDITNLSITSTTPSITAEPDTRYVCTATYVDSLSFTPSATGICSVRFTSGTIPTVLTLPNTVVMPDWWMGCEANCVYEITVTDGVYADVDVWGAIGVGTNKSMNTTIQPIYIGDYLSETVPSCCLKIGTKFVSIDAQLRSTATENSSNEGTIRWFDTANNVELTEDSTTEDVGHANSIAYDGSTVYVVPIWDNSTGEELSANWLYTFDSTMTPKGQDGKETIPSTAAMGVSYDHAQNVLYYLDYSRNIYAKRNGTWTLVTTVNLTGIEVTEFNQGAAFNQDFAVYNGIFYISSPRGVIIYGKIEEGTSNVLGGCLISSTDVLGRYMIGELEGMEFDENGHLYAMMYSGLSNEVRDAFVVELPIGVTRPNASSTDSYDFHDGTLILSEATQTAFWLQPYQIRTISQLEIRILRYNSSIVQIPEGNDVVDDYEHRINDRIKLLLDGTLTVRGFTVFSGLLNIVCNTPDNGIMPRLIFTTSNTIPLNVTRAGELAITGSQRMRISIPNFANLAQLISVGYDFNRTTIRLVPASAENKTYRIGDTVELDDYSVYVGTGKISGVVKIASPATYTTNNYFTRANVLSGGFIIEKVSSTMSIIQARLRVSTNTLPKDTAIEIGTAPFVPAYTNFSILANDGYGNQVLIEILRTKVVKITALDNDIEPLDDNHRIQIVFPVATEPW